jgi:hypothetical protein
MMIAAVRFSGLPTREPMTPPATAPTTAPICSRLQRPEEIS